MVGISVGSPPYPFSTAENTEFTKESLIVRVPHIVTDIINLMHHQVISSNKIGSYKAVEEAKEIIAELSKIKYEMMTNKPIPNLQRDPAPDFDNWHSFITSNFENEVWLKTPFLWWETYLYRRIYGIFQRTEHWKDFDYFESQKVNTFMQSKSAITKLAKRMSDVLQECLESSGDNEVDNKKKLIGFIEVLQNSLWGNQTDLSMFPDLKTADLEKMQAELVSGDKDHSIITNESMNVWKAINVVQSLKSKPQKTQNDIKALTGSDSIAIVLDNSGFELFSDLLLAHWIIKMGYAKQIVFHAKSIPWYVSDVTPNDFKFVIDACASKETFASSQNQSDKESIEQIENLNNLGKQWQEFVINGTWKLQTNTFWNGPYSYNMLPNIETDLWEQLKQNYMIFYKGDLNYRKLISDLMWPADTPFSKASASMICKRQGSPVTVALRTSKAEVMVGVDKKTVEKLEESVPNWRSIGKYGVIQTDLGRLKEYIE
ncbi:hypothetical protein BB559_005824 [Furculomyces boomerangus]|uniref:Sugar phosphate phosphatase n=2 Tax=Harpellales TaxID=61421 RepID=A0A2T9Y6G0_9FUNG|nr:hypothetical protein BB559_005824 [Furculomyces boomerangus]PVZ97625.1 hypothetical protein BB558_006399 [Smittium angustum]PWA02619.1 hypothetical protein BB558_001235 [Smittium angustum]